jgi:hypothetical protein
VRILIQRRRTTDLMASVSTKRVRVIPGATSTARPTSRNKTANARKSRTRFWLPSLDTFRTFAA